MGGLRKASVDSVCGAVWLCGEYHGVRHAVFRKCFCAVYLSGMMLSAMSLLLEKTRLGDLLASGCHFFDGKEFLCGPDHSCCEHGYTNLGFESNVAVV